MNLDFSHICQNNTLNVGIFSSKRYFLVSLTCSNSSADVSEETFASENFHLRAAGQHHLW